MCFDNIRELAIDRSIAKILKSQNNSVLKYSCGGSMLLKLKGI